MIARDMALNNLAIKSCQTPFQQGGPRDKGLSIRRAHIVLARGGEMIGEMLLIGRQNTDRVRICLIKGLFDARFVLEAPKYLSRLKRHRGEAVDRQGDGRAAFWNAGHDRHPGRVTRKGIFQALKGIRHHAALDDLGEKNNSLMTSRGNAAFPLGATRDRVA